MGVGVSSGLNAAAIVQQLIRTKYSILSIDWNNCNANNTNYDQAIKILNEISKICIDLDNAEFQKSIATKELKFMLQIFSELNDVLLLLNNTNLRLKILNIIYCIFSIPSFCKKIIDTNEIFLKFLNTFKVSDIELFIGQIKILLQIFRKLDDDSISSTLFPLLDKSGSISKFFIFITQASVVNDSRMLAATVVIFEMIYWSLSRNHVNLVVVKPKIRSIAFQHKDSLFELSRHPILKISYMTTMICIRLLSLEDKSYCLAMQVFQF
jgi:hypothetical protein